jgi:hypothetical protein
MLLCRPTIGVFFASGEARRPYGVDRYCDSQLYRFSGLNHANRWERPVYGLAWGQVHTENVLTDCFAYRRLEAKEGRDTTFVAQGDSLDRRNTMSTISMCRFF